MSYEGNWAPYVSVAERRKKAERELAKLRKRRQGVAPVVLQGRKLATTFWGKAWNDNLEAYSDYASRLPRGRSYVRNGSVLDLQIERGKVHALVMGSELYEVALNVSPLPKARWKSICKDCSGAIDSLVELLQGRLSKAVMERVCEQKTGLFPAPGDIELSCNCPDWASMCKHVAAVLYGIGARLDEQPALVFKLRDVDEAELIASAATGRALATKIPAPARILEDGDLSALFGLEIESTKSQAPAGSSTGQPKRLSRGKRTLDSLPVPARSPAAKPMNKRSAAGTAAKTAASRGRAPAVGTRDVQSKRSSSPS